MRKSPFVQRSYVAVQPAQRGVQSSVDLAKLLQNRSVNPKQQDFLESRLRLYLESVLSPPDFGEDTSSLVGLQGVSEMSDATVCSSEFITTTPSQNAAGFALREPIRCPLFQMDPGAGGWEQWLSQQLAWFLGCWEKELALRVPSSVPTDPESICGQIQSLCEFYQVLREKLQKVASALINVLPLAVVKSVFRAKLLAMLRGPQQEQPTRSPPGRQQSAGSLLRRAQDLVASALGAILLQGRGPQLIDLDAVSRVYGMLYSVQQQQPCIELLCACAEEFYARRASQPSPSPLVPPSPPQLSATVSGQLGEQLGLSLESASLFLQAARYSLREDAGPISLPSPDISLTQALELAHQDTRLEGIAMAVCVGLGNCLRQVFPIQEYCGLAASGRFDVLAAEIARLQNLPREADDASGLPQAATAFLQRALQAALPPRELTTLHPAWAPAFLAAAVSFSSQDGTPLISGGAMQRELRVGLRLTGAVDSLASLLSELLEIGWVQGEFGSAARLSARQEALLKAAVPGGIQNLGKAIQCLGQVLGLCPGERQVLATLQALFAAQFLRFGAFYQLQEVQTALAQNLNHSLLQEAFAAVSGAGGLQAGGSFILGERELLQKVSAPHAFLQVSGETPVDYIAPENTAKEKLTVQRLAGTYLTKKGERGTFVCFWPQGQPRAEEAISKAILQQEGSLVIVNDLAAFRIPADSFTYDRSQFETAARGPQDNTTDAQPVELEPTRFARQQEAFPDVDLETLAILVQAMAAREVKLRRAVPVEDLVEWLQAQPQLADLTIQAIKERIDALVEQDVLSSVAGQLQWPE